ncbi:MAG: tetratricopeptide repeat protein [Paludibacteraceae bacterium]|nr:tetratricopeptide repeat protein [Paludibacteraceae bacterium]
MKKILVLFALCAVAVLPLRAQWSEIYASEDAEYTEGIALYQQGQFATAQAHLQNYQDDFYYVACAFELRQPLAQKQLKEYLESHPYTPYASEVHYMLGVLRVEAGKYRSARKELSKAVKDELFRQHQDALSFYAGYAHLQMNDLGAAAREFESIKNHGGPYAQMATYYYGYAEYAKGNYGKALPALLSVEKTSKFGSIVPYYIVQIYYQQGQYDEVQSRARELLAQDPNKAVNRSELYRIMGEIAYQQQAYDSSIVYLKEYNRLSAEEGSKPVRADMYLLGISEFKTGRYADAIASLKQVKPLNDTLTQSTQLHLGHCYRAQGMKEQAKMAYTAAMRYAGKGSESAVSRKTREEAMYNYALTTYEAGGMPGESVTAFTNFLKEYPQSKHRTEVYSLLSSVFMNSKDYAQALNALNAIEDPAPEMVLTKQYLRYQLGTDAFLNGKYSVASGWFDELISNASLSALRGQKEASTYLREAWFWKAESEYRLGNYDEAAQAVSAFRSHPDAAKSANYAIADYLQAYVFFQRKEYKSAATRFRMFIERADKSQATYPDALNRLGDCAFANRDFIEAESWYQKAIQTGGTGTDYAMFQRGYTLGLLNRYGEKVSEMDALVRKYPHSDYADDALYEIARAELRRDNTSGAIDAYDRLLKGYPNSTLTTKAALEKAMLYYNDHRYDDAIAAYKHVVERYPNSDEARAALEGIETCYVETNRVAEYLAYTKTLKGAAVSASNEDSLTFVAAERLYLTDNDAEAIPALNKYITAWCDGGQHCIQARYYLADAYYRQGQKPEAKQAYMKLAERPGNPYLEEAVMRVAEIAYDEQDYQTALRYFQQLERVASSRKNTDIARLGVLRTAYFLGDNATTVEIASTLLSDPTTDPEVQDEARYNRAKAYLALKHLNSAKDDLEILAEDVRTEHGAEAKYLLAQTAFDQGNLDQAEAEVMAFAGMNTSHQYWLARAFVLLADIYVARGDDFQAQQYLLSLQQNYRVEDDIQTLCADRMDAIVARNIETTNQEQQVVEEDDDDEDDDE